MRFLKQILLFPLRTIPDNYFPPPKAILDQQTTDNLCNEINNRALDTKSKGLRSSKSKQSCIILDDYDFVSEGPIPGKSPIDSLCGLVESIEARSQDWTAPSNTTSNVNRQHTPTETKAETIAPKAETIASNAAHLKASAINDTNKAVTGGKSSSGSNVTKSIYHSTCKKEQESKCSSQKNLEVNKPHISIVTQKKEPIDPLQNSVHTKKVASPSANRAKRRKISTNVKTEHLNEPKIKKEGKAEKVKTTTEHEIASSTETDKSTGADNRKKRKKPKRLILVKRRKNTVPESLSSPIEEKDLKNENCSTFPNPVTTTLIKTAKPKRRSIAAEAKPLAKTSQNKKLVDAKQEKAKSQKTKQYVNKNNIIKPKRIDPIMLALKNIRNYESLRRGSRISTLNMVTRRAMIGLNEDPYGNLSNKRKSLKERIAKNKSLLKKKSSKPTTAKPKSDDKPAKQSEKLANIEETNKEKQSVKIDLATTVTTTTTITTQNENKKATIADRSNNKITVLLLDNIKPSVETIAENQTNKSNVKPPLDQAIAGNKPNVEKLKHFMDSLQIKTEKIISAEQKPEFKPNEQVPCSNLSSTKYAKLTLSAVSKIIESEYHRTVKQESPIDDSSLTSIDLMCHEKALSPEDTVQFGPTLILPIMQTKKKNRRKPLHVFKSLPNPALEEKETDGTTKNDGNNENGNSDDNAEDEATRQKGSKSPVKKSHNTRFRGSKSVVPSHMSPRTNKKRLLKTPTIKKNESKNHISVRNSITEDYAEHSSVPASKLPFQVKPSPIKRLQRPALWNVSVKLYDDKQPIIKEEEEEEEDDNSSNGSSIKDDGIEGEHATNGNHNNDSSASVKTMPKPKKRKKHVAVYEYQKKLRPLTRCSDDAVQVGDVVWGKILGYGWWPGVVLSDAPGSLETSSNPPKERSVHVSWMSSNTSSAMDVKELELFLPNFNKRFDVRKTSNYVRAVTEAQQACASKYGLLS